MAKSTGIKGLMEHMATLDGRRLSVKSLPSIFFSSLPSSNPTEASFIFSAQSPSVSPSPSVYGWHYRLSRVISRGQSQHLTLRRPSSASSLLDTCSSFTWEGSCWLRGGGTEGRRWEKKSAEAERVHVKRLQREGGHFGLIKIDHEAHVPQIFTTGRRRGKRRKKNAHCLLWASYVCLCKIETDWKENRISVCLPERQTERKQGWKSHEGGVHKGFGS